MNPPAVIDWFRLLRDLIQRWHSIAAIEKRSGIAESTLRGYLQGSHPPHWRGEVLIALWCQSCEKGRDDLPMTELYIAPRVVERKAGPEVNDSMELLERAWR